MSNVLETLYASAPVNDFIYHTLELRNADFNVDGHIVGAIRLVQGFDDVSATLEDNTIATFKASGFGVSLPEKGIKGRQDLSFLIDNVSGEALRAIEDAIEGGGKIIVIYRAYVGSDLSAPGQPPIMMTATAVEADYSSISVSATFHDLVNKAWPFRRYTPTFAPGLKYYG